MDGEEGFRARHSKIFSQELAETKRGVIPRGGGIVLREENRALLKA